MALSELNSICSFFSLQPDQSITTVDEGSNDRNCESAEITNLTAEIESFVKTADTDDDHLRTTSTVLRIDEEEPERPQAANAERQSPENNDYYSSERAAADGQAVTLEKIENLGGPGDLDVINNSERSKVSPVKILIRAPTEDDDPEEPQSSQNGKTPESTGEITEPRGEKVAAEREEETGEHEKSIAEANESVSSVTTVEDFRNARSSTPTSTEVENILERSTSHEVSAEASLGELHITESNENLAESTAESLEESKREENHNFSSVVSPRYEVRHIPLKDSSPQPNQNEKREEFLAADSDDNDVVIRRKESPVQPIPPTPPRRRRSVKEIIESINKSQSLLKVNRDRKQRSESKIINLNTIPQLVSKDTNFADRNINDSVVKEYQEKKMFSEAKEVNNNSQSNGNGVASTELGDVENNNAVLFPKCVIRGDDNANANGNVSKVDNGKANVEWNPVPKPRRHRHSVQGTIN